MSQLTLTGPPGAGKTAIIRRLMQEYPDLIKPVRSFTTRDPRPSDVKGEYEYVTVEEFMERKLHNDFMWTASVHMNMYGTHRSDLHRSLIDQEHLYVMAIVPDVVPLLRRHVTEEALDEEAPVDPEILRARNEAAERIVNDDLLHLYFRPPQDPDAWVRRLLDRGETQQSAVHRMMDAAKWTTAAEKSDIPYVFLDDAPQSIDQKYALVVEMIQKKFPLLLAESNAA